MKKLFGKVTNTVEGDQVEIIGVAQYKDEPDQFYVRYTQLKTAEGLPLKQWVFPGQLEWPDELNNTKQ